MKNNISYKALYSLAFIVLTISACSNLPIEKNNQLTQSKTVFNEENGVVIIEAESTVLPRGWQEKTDKNASSQQYIEWLGDNNFQTPGIAALTYTVNIKTPGHYQILWRNKIAFGNNSKDFNDSWLKVIGSHSFYGKKQDKEHIVCPFGLNSQYNHCQGSAPNGSSADGWFKVYRTGEVINNWSWSTNTSDDDKHNIWVEFIKPGSYQLQLSARSKHHAIDKIALVKHEKNKTMSDDFYNTLSLATENQQNLPAKESTVLEATKDFIFLNQKQYDEQKKNQQSPYAPAYVDKYQNALAVNAVIYKDIFSVASTAFTGTKGLYGIKLNTLTELDGESHYQLFINDQLIGAFINPTTNIDYFPVTKTWNNISLAKGDVIKVTFNSVTNGKIPEGDITAFSRGRWTGIEVIPQ